MKRLFDLVLALVLALPVLVFVGVLSVLIMAIDGYMPFHCQRRKGRYGRNFWCCKLQTMRPAARASDIGDREKDACRATRFGNIIRDHGWDELPQIVNVLIGNMSFVGPRPLLCKTYERIRAKNPDMITRIDKWQRSRQAKRPGITGWHQVQIRKRASIIDCDLHSVSFWENVRIARTTIRVFFCSKSHSATRAS